MQQINAIATEVETNEAVFGSQKGGINLFRKAISAGGITVAIRSVNVINQTTAEFQHLIHQSIHGIL